MFVRGRGVDGRTRRSPSGAPRPTGLDRTGQTPLDGAASVDVLLRSPENWAVGVDLGDNGKPLRSMKTPRMTGDPDHVDQMKDFDPADIEEDFGGVHTF